MSIIKNLLLKRKNTAQIAKERLQIIVQHERIRRHAGVVNLQELQQKLVSVIASYLNIGQEEVQVTVELEKDENRSILELNVTLPDQV